MIKLRYPDITVPGPIDPIRRLQGYLCQVVDELNIALTTLDTQATEAKEAATAAVTAAGNAGQKAPKAAFNDIKALIIKSAEIVEAYYEVINKRLEGQYVAKSEFGEYTEATAAEIEANSTSITQLYENMQQIISDIEQVENTIIEVNAHIKTGLLDYDDTGAPVYGLEIGQRTEVNGDEVFNKYARFTADRLSFYDSNDNEVAYISDRKLYINDVEVTGSFQISGFLDTVMGDGSVVTKWVGGGA